MLSVAQLPHVESCVAGLQVRYGHIDLQGVQSSTEPQTLPPLGCDPELPLSHRQQGGLPLDGAVVKVEACQTAVALLRGAGELQ